MYKRLSYKARTQDIVRDSAAISERRELSEDEDPTEILYPPQSYLEPWPFEIGDQDLGLNNDNDQQKSWMGRRYHYGSRLKQTDTSQNNVRGQVS